MRKPICGVGINDADYVTQINYNSDKVQKRIWCCPFYERWTGVIKRCYSKSVHKKYPSYSSCTMDPNWLYFSNFKAWMEAQDWQGKDLDKDLLIKGNKHYSPENCVFVDQLVNVFILDCKSRRESELTGAYKRKGYERYSAACRNPFTGKLDALGYFKTAEEAHAIWKNKKHEHACRIADMQTDQRVAIALRQRYI